MNWKNYVLALMLLAVVMETGIMYGWTALSKILRDDNIYYEGCDPTASYCKKQDAALDLVYFVSVGVQCTFGVVNGLILDKVGAAWLCLFGTVFQVAGLVLLGFSEDYLLYAAVFVGIGGSALQYTSFLVVHLVPKRFQTTAISAASCMFDASTVVFPILLEVGAMASLNRKELMFGYAAATTIVLFLLCIGWFKVAYYLQGAGSEIKDDVSLLSEEIATSATDSALDKNTSVVYSDNGSITTKFKSHHDWKKLNFQSLPLGDQVNSPPFYFILIFCLLNISISIFYLGTVGNQLEFQGDTDGQISRLVGAVIPCGAFLVFIIAALINSLGIHGTFMLSNILCILWCTLAMAPNLYLQVVTGALYTCYRGLLFSIINTYFPLGFGTKNLGRITSICYTLSGALSFASSPMAHWVLTNLNGDFFYVNLLFTILLIPMTMYTWRMKDWFNALFDGEETPKHQFDEEKGAMAL